MVKVTEPSWKDYEDLIHKIYTELEPIADVRLNDHITGIDSQTLRQIDVSIRSKIGIHDILIIVQGKKHKKRADLNIVGEFASVIKDVQASKGVLICNAGFTKNAKEYASKLKIDLCTVHDATIKNWQTEIQIPVLKKSIKIFLKIQHHYVPVGPIEVDGISMPFPNLAVQQFIEKWEKNELDKSPGTHYFALDKDLIKLHDNSWSLKSGIEYTIVHRHHFKYFVPIDYRGIKDYITEKFTPSFMAFNETIPFLNDGTWKYIDNPNEISIKTILLNIEVIDMDFVKERFIRSVWENVN